MLSCAVPSRARACSARLVRWDRPPAIPCSHPRTELNAKHDWGLTIHIDGASGAFVAPFLYPNLKWDFRLTHVASINASGAPRAAQWRAPGFPGRRCLRGIARPSSSHPQAPASLPHPPAGHKYGLVYPGLGWVIWRDASQLPEAMVFYENYLGTLERSITLNFSKPATNIIAQ